MGGRGYGESMLAAGPATRQGQAVPCLVSKQFFLYSASFENDAAGMGV